MQHPDEGTIHSWLDGALSAEEAARVEAHVKECPECAAAVAEARGFIAGASRILTALDNAPRGVIPAATPKKRIDPWVLRVAATVLVVAAGTLVVVRNQGGNTQTQSTLAERVSATSVPAAAAPMPSDSAVVEDKKASSAGSGSRVPESAPMAANGAVPRVRGTTPEARVKSAPSVALKEKSGVRDQDSGAPSRSEEMMDRRTVMQPPQTVVAGGTVGGVVPTPLMRAPSRVTGYLAMDSVSQPGPLKVVGTPRRIGAKVTLYEVAPGDTVTLTEAMPVALESVVVTGLGSARVQGSSRMSPTASDAQSRGRSDAVAIAKVSDSARAAAAPTSAPPAAPTLTARTGTLSTVHAITWTDSMTKSTLTLTGKLPEARLQEIRIRIQKERAAAAAAAKKSP